MPTDYNKAAVYDVRKWLIAQLYADGILNSGWYPNSTPIVPIQQVSPTNKADTSSIVLGIPDDSPFIVYDVIIPAGGGDDFYCKMDEVSLWIYSSEVKKAMQIKEYLVDLLGRSDLSARDLNAYNVTNSTGSPFQFHYFEIYGGLPTNETNQKFDRYGVNFVFGYEYTRPILSSTGRFAS